MPQIHEYNADAQVEGPFQTRQARDLDTGNVGSAIEGFGNALTSMGKELHQRKAQAEISELAAQMAEKHAEYTNGLEETLKTSDPNDKEISSNFMQGYDDDVGSIGDNLSTPEAQNYFKRANANMRGHFLVKSMHGQSVMAGEAQVQNYQQATGALSASLEKDPSGFENTKDLHDMSVQAMVDNGQISENHADQLRAQGETLLAKGAIRGWNEIDPDYADKMLKSGKFDEFFDTNEKKAMEGEVKTAQNAKRIEQGRLDKQAQEALEAKQEAWKDKALDTLYKDGLSTDDVLKSPLNASDKEHFLKMIEAKAQNKIKDDPAAVIEAFRRIQLPDSNPQHLTDQSLARYVINGKMGLTTYKSLRDEIHTRKTEAGMEEGKLKDGAIQIAKDMLTKSNPLTGVKDPEGDAHVQSFMVDFYNNYEKGKKAGKTPQQMLTPGSPDYLVDGASKYQRKPMDILQSIISNTFGPSAGSSQNPAANPSAGASQNNPQAPRQKVTSDRVSEYANKYKMSKDAAKNYLKGKGYDVD